MHQRRITDYLSLKRFSQASRKAVVGTCLAFLVIFFVWPYYRDFGIRLTDDEVKASAPKPKPVCEIWPGWQGSNASRYVFGEVNQDVPPVVPLLGNASFIGDATQCILPRSRFNQYYNAPAGQDWSYIKWGQIQRQCTGPKIEVSEEDQDLYDVWHQPPKTTPVDEPPPIIQHTAIIFRTWENYNYSNDRVAWLRAMIAETALQSGGEYEVFFLVNVKDDAVPLDEDRAAYEARLKQSVPAEFRDMSLLYNRRLLEKWYPLVPEHGPQDQMYQALEIFSHQFPRFTHLWQLEMDFRLTGHFKSFLDTTLDFARAQPRRNLWERNGRFYIPQLHGNSFDTFVAKVDEEIGDGGIWGPALTTGFVPLGPDPPPRTEHNWGKGEEPDLISLMPMIDPVGTEWVYEHMVHGFEDGFQTPRRVAFVSMTRASTRLLRLISDAQRENGQWVFSEATPETFALLHGFKAVTVPQPISFAISDMTPEKINEWVNRGPPHSQAGGFKPAMSYTTTGYVPGPWGASNYWWSGNDGPNLWHRYLKGECLPPMLLHPIKDE